MTSSLLSSSASSSVASNPLINQNSTGSGTSSGSSSGAASSLNNYNFMEFLTLFTTQLKNQDPTNPMDTTQMTNQLAMFSQVEQQAGTNSRLDRLIAAQPTSGLNSGVGYIGKNVEASGDQITLASGSARIAYQMPQSATSVSIAISNSNGALVKTLTGSGTTGIQRMSWDGTDNSGAALPDGVYTVSVTVPTTTGSASTITPVTRSTGKVTGVESNGTTTVLDLGNQQINLSNVLAIM